MQTKQINMDKMEKKSMMEKMIRELEDISNTQTSLLKKVAQLEADNINLGNTLLDKRLPDIHEKVDAGVSEISAVLEEFTAAKDKFVSDNRLDEVFDDQGNTAT